MQLDFVERTGAFIVRVPRGASHDIQSLMKDHGLDFSSTASTSAEAVLFTREPYAAASFFQYATSSAREQLGSIITEIEASWALDNGGHFAVPADQELWGFQRANLAYALRRRNTLIGDQPGLGKTPTAIAFANEVQAKRVLVICPANIRMQWAKKIQEWSTMPWTGTRRTHVIMKTSHGVSPVAPWTIVSYDMCRVPAIWKALAREWYDVLIIDEAHYLKTVDARRTRAVFGGGDAPVAASIASRCERILALTGTPLPNRPREAYTLARHLNFDSIHWLSEDGFKARFNPSIKRTTPEGKIFVDERTGRHAELQSRLRANFMTRHLKREVMPQLKLPAYDIIQLEETGPVKQALLAESLLDIDPEMLEGADAAILGQVAAVRKQMGVALAPQIADYVDMLIDGGEEKIVLFAWHVEVMNILEERLHKHGVSRIDGSTSSTQRDRRKQAFIENPRVQIMLGNLLAMGVGTDGLQHVSSHVLIAEPDWTPGNNQQAIDRLDRGGQTRTVQADLFVAPNSIAERILASSLRKLSCMHASLDKRV